MAEILIDGAMLRAQRRAKGVRPKDLAAALGVSTDYLRHVEMGTFRLRPALAETAARVIGVPLETLGSPAPEVPVLDGAALRAARLAAGLSQAALADALGVSHTYISHLEAGRRPRTKDGFLARVADALGVPPSQLEARQ